MSTENIVTRVYFARDSKAYNAERDSIEEIWGEYVIEQVILGNKYITHASKGGLSPVNYVLSRLSNEPDFKMVGRTLYVERISKDRIFFLILNDGSLEASGIHSIDYDFSNILVIDDFNSTKFLTFVGGDKDSLESIEHWKHIEQTSEKIYSVPNIRISDNKEYIFHEPEKKNNIFLTSVLALAIVVIFGLIGKEILWTGEVQVVEEVQDDPWDEYNGFVKTVIPAPTVMTSVYQAIYEMTNIKGWDWSRLVYENGRVGVSIKNLGGHIDEVLSFRTHFDNVTTNLGGTEFILIGDIRKNYPEFPNEIVISGSEINYFIYMCLTTNSGIKVSYKSEEVRKNYFVQMYSADVSAGTVDALNLIGQCIGKVPVKIDSLEIQREQNLLAIKIDYTTFSRKP